MNENGLGPLCGINTVIKRILSYKTIARHATTVYTYAVKYIPSGTKKVYFCLKNMLYRNLYSFPDISFFIKQLHASSIYMFFCVQPM